MDITYQERKELNALSKEIFGSSSRWKKILDKGLPELVTHKVAKTETIDGVETTKEVEEALLAPNTTKVRQYTQKYYTLETLTAWMKDLKQKRDEYLAKVKKEEEERKAKEEQDKMLNKTHEEFGGSAL